MRSIRGTFVICLLLVFAVTATWAGGKEEVAAGELPPVTLSWLYPGPYPQPDQEEVFAKANEIIQDKINATVEFRVMDWGTYKTKMPAIIGAGEKFDLCFTAGWMNNYTLNANNGAYVALDDLLTTYAPGLYKSIPSGAWEASRVNGKIYGIPNQQIWAYWDHILVIKDLVDKYGWDLSTLKRPEDVEPMLQDIKDNEPDMYPTEMRSAMIDFLNHYHGLDFTGAPGLVVRYKDSTATVLSWWEVPEVVEWLKRLQTWYAKGYIRPDILTWKENSARAEIKARKYGFRWHNTGKPGNEEEQKASYGYEWAMVRWGEPVMTTTNIIATMHAVSSTSDNPERAVQLMELMYTDKDLYNLIAFGIEGKHYTKIGENRVERIPDSGYNPNTLWLHGTTFNAYLVGTQPDDLWEETAKLNADAYPSVLLGFNLDLDPIKTLVASVKEAPSQYERGLKTGAIDFDENYPKLLDALRKAGIDELKAKVQDQIDAWLKTR